MGVERSEQNNPVSCFANGDRRFLRDVTLDKIQNIEQKSRTTPRGDTIHYHVSDKITKIRLIARLCCHKAYHLFWLNRFPNQIYWLFNKFIILLLLINSQNYSILYLPIYLCWTLKLLEYSTSIYTSGYVFESSPFIVTIHFGK